jgi:hypothetical protein
MVNVRIKNSIVSSVTLNSLRRHPDFKAYLALISVCFFWGTTYLGIRMALESFPPLALVSIRFLLSGSILLAAAVWRGAVLPTGRDLRNACLSGVLILGIGNGALVFAEVKIPSGLAGLFITISPFWLVGLEALLRRTAAALAYDFRHVDRLAAPRCWLRPIGARPSWPTRWRVPDSADRWLQLVFGIDLPKEAGEQGASDWWWERCINWRPAWRLFRWRLLVHEHPRLELARGGGGGVLVIFGSIVGYSSYAYALDKLPVAVVSVYPYQLNCGGSVGMARLPRAGSDGWAGGDDRDLSGMAVVSVTPFFRTLAPSAPPAVQITAVTVNENNSAKM